MKPTTPAGRLFPVLFLLLSLLATTLEAASCGAHHCYTGCPGIRPKVDLIFLFDISQSMAPKVSNIINALDRFALNLDNTTDPLFGGVYFGRGSFSFATLLENHPPELKSQLVTAFCPLLLFFFLFFFSHSAPVTLLALASVIFFFFFESGFYNII